ncbi:MULTISPECIES: hypothetical protein [Actinomycetes]|nr:hypothetical protein [Aeromicrobium sp.]MBC7632899.1 hypothetical protein [Aeromicrobium sp.]
MTRPLTIPLTLVGDPTAAACEGDSCAIPDHHEQAVVNRRLDEDLV